MKGIDFTHVIVACIGALATVGSAWLAYRRGRAKPCTTYDLTRHPLFERMRYMREIMVPRLDVGHEKKTECTRKFLAIKLETFERGMKAWAANPEPMHSGDVVGVITSLVREYEEQALRAGVPDIYVQRFAKHHMPVVESTIDALASIANSGMYSEKEKQAAALDILLYSFTLTIYSAEEAISSLNGQLEAALEGRTCHD